MVVSSVFDILALIFINDTAMDTPFMGVTSEQSKLRATTRKIDRVTYAIIGLNVGFSTGLALSGYIVSIRFQDMNIDASLVIVFFPLLLAGFTLLLFRNKYQYLIEHISKEYLSACVVACLLAIVLLPEPAKVFFLALLIFFADVQLLIAINAGIEFIVFERLSPVWYITEYGIIMLGAAAGVVITSVLTSAALDFQRLTLLCALVAVTNVALQPTINRGRYPLPAALTSDNNSRLAAQQMVENDLDQAGESNVVSNSDVADSKLSPPSPASDVWDEVIESLCKSGGLSPRQREILPYLAKGRDAHYLENRFFISHATAKSHIYSIYRKLGVHSRQELIDLVESLQNMKRDSNQ